MRTLRVGDWNLYIIYELRPATAAEQLSMILLRLPGVMAAVCPRE